MFLAFRADNRHFAGVTVSPAETLCVPSVTIRSPTESPDSTNWRSPESRPRTIRRFSALPSLPTTHTQAPYESCITAAGGTAHRFTPSLLRSVTPTAL